MAQIVPQQAAHLLAECAAQGECSEQVIGQPPVLAGVKDDFGEGNRW